MSDSRFDCGRALDLLQDFLKQELTPEVAAQVRTHLDRCGHCDDHAQWERHFLAAIEAAARGGKCPEAFRQDLLRRLRAEG